jgi:hypothetical protein
MNNEDFEKQLGAVPFRALPDNWREDILKKAQIAGGRSSPGEKTVIAQKKLLCWRDWLWPWPTAWAALAASWTIIIGVNLALSKLDAPSGNSALAIQSTGNANLPEQRKFLSQLLDSGSPPLPSGSSSSTSPRRGELPLKQIAT